MGIVRDYNLRSSGGLGATICVAVASGALLLMPGLSPSAAQTRPEGAVYVAPSGRDSWSGHMPVANPAGTDGPLATLSAAVSAIRHKPGSRTVVVRDGAYMVTRPLQLGSDDAGTSFVAFPGEHPVLYGGGPITRWQRSDDHWIAPLPAPLASAAGLPTLIGAGKMLPITRIPDVGAGEDHESAWFFADSTPPGADAHRSFRVRPADRAVLAALGANAWIDIFGQRGWQNYIRPIDHVDLDRGIITLDGTTWDALGEGSRFAVLNAPTPPDVGGPASWRYDFKTNHLILPRPPPAEQANAFIAASVPCIISVAQTHDVAVTGFGLIGSATQGAAICVSDSHNVTLDRLDIVDTGEGVRVEHAGFVTITHSTIAQTAASAISLRRASDNARVEGNWLHDIGWLQADANAIAFDGSSHARILRNRIERVTKFAIGGGSLTEGGAYDNLIEGNEIDQANRRTSDGGGILVIGWAQEASHDIIRGNFISRTTALGNVGWDGRPHTTFQDPLTSLVSQAIYLDDWASDVQVSGNLLCDNIGGIELHAGWNNQIYDNLLIGNTGIAFDIDAVSWLGTGAHPHPMEHNAVEHNFVMLMQPGTGQSGIAAVRGGAEAALFDHNLYVGPGLNQSVFHHAPDHIWSRYSFGIETWRHNGQDASSDVGAIAAKVAVLTDKIEISGSATAPPPFRFNDIGRAEDHDGLANRIRQRCDLR